MIYNQSLCKIAVSYHILLRITSLEKFQERYGGIPQQYKLCFASRINSQLLKIDSQSIFKTLVYSLALIIFQITLS